MSDTKELIERLRDWASWDYVIQEGELADIVRDCIAAADTIARLEAERDAVRLLLARVLDADEGGQVLGSDLAAAIREAMEKP